MSFCCNFCGDSCSNSCGYTCYCCQREICCDCITLELSVDVSKNKFHYNWDDCEGINSLYDVAYNQTKKYYDVYLDYCKNAKGKPIPKKIFIILEKNNYNNWEEYQLHMIKNKKEELIIPKSEFESFGICDSWKTYYNQLDQLLKRQYECVYCKQRKYLMKSNQKLKALLVTTNSEIDLNLVKQIMCGSHVGPTGPHVGPTGPTHTK